jgi:hypothetical protein
MKTLDAKQLAIRSLVVLISAMSLFSFETLPGGDSFSIYMNDKLLVQQFVHLKEKAKTISVQQVSANDVLKIQYSHCGKIGVARNLLLKDEHNKTIKTWKFRDSDDVNKAPMTIQAVDVAAIQKQNSSKKLSLVYLSEQLPDGIVVAYFGNEDTIKASIE